VRRFGVAVGPHERDVQPHVYAPSLPSSSFILLCAVIDSQDAAGGDTADKSDRIHTELVRTAIWNYVQRLYGVCNDHYDYKNVRFALCTYRCCVYVFLVCFQENQIPYSYPVRCFRFLLLR
jgi:hypothetical protein